MHWLRVRMKNWGKRMASDEWEGKITMGKQTEGNRKESAKSEFKREEGYEVFVTDYKVTIGDLYFSYNSDLNLGFEKGIEIWFEHMLKGETEMKNWLKRPWLCIINFMKNWITRNMLPVTPYYPASMVLIIENWIYYSIMA